MVEVRWYTLDGTSLPLFITPVFFLFWLALLNIAVRRMLPRLAPRLTLNQAELLTVYMVLVVGTLVAGHDMFQNLFGSIGHAERFRDSRKQVEDALFFRFCLRSGWCAIRMFLKAYYLGNVNPYDPRYWGAFVGPLAWWALFIGTAHRHLSLYQHSAAHSVERPRTPRLPDRATAGRDDRGGRQGARCGRAVPQQDDVDRFRAGGSSRYPERHALHLSFPAISLDGQAVRCGTVHHGAALEARWAGTNISLYPFAIGLAFFVPLDLSFSCWFFFLARKMFQVFGAATGLDGPGSQGFPYFRAAGQRRLARLGPDHRVGRCADRSSAAGRWRSAKRH